MPRKFREHLMRELDCTTHKARRKCFPITRRQCSFMVNYSKTKTSWHLWTWHKIWACVKSLICTNIKYYRKYSIYLLSRLYAILLSNITFLNYEWNKPMSLFRVSNEKIVISSTFIQNWIKLRPCIKKNENHYFIEIPRVVWAPVLSMLSQCCQHRSPTRIGWALIIHCSFWLPIQTIEFLMKLFLRMNIK